MFIRIRDFSKMLNNNYFKNGSNDDSVKPIFYVYILEKATA